MTLLMRVDTVENQRIRKVYIAKRTPMVEGEQAAEKRRKRLKRRRLRKAPSALTHVEG